MNFKVKSSGLGFPLVKVVLICPKSKPRRVFPAQRRTVGFSSQFYFSASLSV
jgi:hypothetical protein